MWLIRRSKKENMNLYVNQHIIRGIYEVEGNKNLVSLIPEEFPFFVCHLYNMWGKYLTVYCLVSVYSPLLVLLVLFWFCCCFCVVWSGVELLLLLSFKSSSLLLVVIAVVVYGIEQEK